MTERVARGQNWTSVSWAALVAMAASTDRHCYLEHSSGALVQMVPQHFVLWKMPMSLAASQTLKLHSLRDQCSVLISC